MKKFILMVLTLGFLASSTLSFALEFQPFVADQSYLFYQMVPKVTQVKVKTIVTQKVIVNPTPWVYQYPYQPYPFYQSNCSPKYYIYPQSGLLERILMIPANLINVCFNTSYYMYY
jgi:hypothetical protein